MQHAGVVLGIGGIGSHAFKCQPGNFPGYFGRAGLLSSYSAVTAACLVIKKEIFLQVGGFDAENLAVAFSDVDLCLKVIEAGYRNVWTPYSLLYHHESATRGDDDTEEKQARFASEIAYMNSRWGHMLLNDPAYSPNLTLHAEDFSFAWPPRLKLSGSQPMQA
jgi:GT2 family glycosyltransferase